MKRLVLLSIVPSMLAPEAMASQQIDNPRSHGLVVLADFPHTIEPSLVARVTTVSQVFMLTPAAPTLKALEFPVLFPDPMDISFQFTSPGLRRTPTFHREEKPVTRPVMRRSSTPVRLSKGNYRR